VSMSAGNQCQIGTMGKPLHAGFAAKNGILAASLAAAGATASRRAIEDGFLQSYCSDKVAGFSGPLAKLGKTLAIEEHGLVIKRYPSCGYTHRVIDGVLDLRKKYGVSASNLQNLTASIPAHFLKALRYDIPADEREALFSLPYCVGVAVRHGAVGFEHFTKDAINEPDVLTVARRVTVNPYEPSDENFNMGPEAPDIVRMRLADGTECETSVDFPVGMPARPISDADLDAKFMSCTRRALSPRAAREALSRLRRLETAASIDVITQHLSGSSALSRA